MPFTTTQRKSTMYPSPLMAIIIMGMVMTTMTTTNSHFVSCFVVTTTTTGRPLKKKMVAMNPIATTTTTRSNNALAWTTTSTSISTSISNLVLTMSSSSSVEPEENVDNDNDNDDDLLLIGNIEEAMQQIRRTSSHLYPTSEAAYLSEARKRANEKRESINNQATDEDWMQVAKAKKRERQNDAGADGAVAVDDDEGWEASLHADNEQESEIIFMPATKDGEDGGDKLMLF